jgi:hypothetical protein
MPRTELHTVRGRKSHRAYSPRQARSQPPPPPPSRGATPRLGASERTLLGLPPSRCPSPFHACTRRICNPIGTAPPPTARLSGNSSPPARSGPRASGADPIWVAGRVALWGGSATRITRLGGGTGTGAECCKRPTSSHGHRARPAAPHYHPLHTRLLSPRPRPPGRRTTSSWVPSTCPARPRPRAAARTTRRAARTARCSAGRSTQSTTYSRYGIHS